MGCSNIPIQRKKMVLAKRSGKIISIRGSFGGVYFKCSPDGQHIQSTPRITQSTHVKIKGHSVTLFSACGFFWAMALVAGMSIVWAAFALVWLFTDKKGATKIISGYNWYMHLAMQLPHEVRPPLWKPPPSPHKLPDKLVTFEGNWTYEHQPKDWPDYCPAGYFYESGTHQGKPSYFIDKGLWVIQWTGDHWIIFLMDGPGLVYYTYHGTGPDVEGEYYNEFQDKYAQVYIGHPED